MQAMKRFILAWIAAAIVTTMLAVILQTQNLLFRLSAIGADVSIADRLSMTAYDLFRFGTIYVIFVGIGTLIAYLCGLLLCRVTGIMTGWVRTVIFMTAGAVAILVILLGVKQAFFGIQLIAGARGVIGISLQMIAGGIGGWVFASWTARIPATLERLAA